MSKLYRSTRDKMVTGLCGGLSETLGIDATLLRILVLISIPFSGSTTLWIYFIASLIIPKESAPPFNQYGHVNPGYGNHGNGAGGYNKGSYQSNNSSHSSDLDEMMKDIEKKALKKEVEELKIKLSKYEKGEV